MGNIASPNIIKASDINDLSINSLTTSGDVTCNGDIYGHFPQSTKQRIFDCYSLMISGGSSASCSRFLTITVKVNFFQQMHKIPFLADFGGYGELYFSFSNSSSFSPGISTFRYGYSTTGNARYYNFYCDYGGTDSNGFGIYRFYVYVSSAWARGEIYFPMMAEYNRRFNDVTFENVSLDVSGVTKNWEATKFALNF